MTAEESPKSAKPDEASTPICGLVMPISPLDGCSEQHWLDVKSILTEAIEAAGFKALLVSQADDVGVIQRRIIHNLDENPMVVCDVSGKNANVMLELGIRLAFDKPVIIVKDHSTDYSFDTAPIEHLGYPRDLRFNTIVQFKKTLAAKIQGTYKASSDPSYTTFLKHFEKPRVVQFEPVEITKDEYIIEELRELRRAVRRLAGTATTRTQDWSPSMPLWRRLASYTDETHEEFCKAIREADGAMSATLRDLPKSERKKAIRDYVFENSRTPELCSQFDFFALFDWAYARVFGD